MYIVVWRLQNRQTQELKKDEDPVLDFLRIYAQCQEKYFRNNPNDGKTHQYASSLAQIADVDHYFDWPRKDADWNAYSRRPWCGYCFKFLLRQGPSAPGGLQDFIVGDRLIRGHALVAIPFSKHASVCDVFVVNKDGRIWRKYYGQGADSVSEAIGIFDPDSTWSEVGPSE